MDEFVKKLRSIDVASLLLALVLLVGMMSLPYGFYTFVKIFATIVFCMLAVDFYNRKSPIGMWLAIIAIILFQPFINIRLGKELWSVVDLVAAVALIALTFFRVARYKDDEK